MLRKYLPALLAFSALIFAVQPARALVWTQGGPIYVSSTDFSGGIFNKTTSTVDNAGIHMLNIGDWYTVEGSTFQNRLPLKMVFPTNVTGKQQKLNFGSRIKNYISAGKIRTDGADIRFADSDGKTLIPFWIDLSSTAISAGALATCTTTQIWVRIPSAAASTTKTIYMYYNNPSTATSFSNRDAVDDFYEDFEGGNFNKWSLGGNANFTIVQSSPIEGRHAAQTGSIIDGQVTYMHTLFSIDADAQLSFWWASSCEDVRANDYMVLQINGQEIPPQFCRVFGETVYYQLVKDLTAGAVDLQWTYIKNNSITMGKDCAWVDNVVVRKSAPDTTSDDSFIFGEVDESYLQNIYKHGTYYSSIFDSGAENSTINKATWSYVNADGTLNITLRYSNYIFDAADMSGNPNIGSQSVISNVQINNARGRYFQYIADLTSNAGTTAPTLIQIGIQYESPPTRPTGFKGVTISSDSINWSWYDNGGNELGFRLFSGTATFDSTVGYYSSGTVDGLMYTIPANTTYYVEKDLVPDLLYSRFVVAYSTAGANIASIVITSDIAKWDCVTMAQAPQINAEYGYIDDYVTNHVTYTAIPAQNFTANSTFFFTSVLFSTGPGTAEYYRIAWDESPTKTWAGTETLWYAPTTFLSNDVLITTANARPQLSEWLGGNTTSAYFHCASYNLQNVNSGTVDLGPFYFNGCPSRITDLSAVPSTIQEGAINLSWSAPTANSTFPVTTNGFAGTYIMKWGPALIVNDAAFASAPYGIIITTTTTPGLQQHMVITGLTPGSFYGFAIKSVDSQNNYSSLSTNVNYSTNTRCNAAAVSKIVFKNLPPTTVVGLPTSVLTIECQDSQGNPLKLASTVSIILTHDGTQDISALKGFSENSFPWSPTDSVSINEGASPPQASFYYKDNAAGSHVIAASYGTWTPASQTVTVQPGKAVKFVLDVNTAQDLGNHAQVTVRANDGQSDANTSQDYIGGIIATSTVMNSMLKPATHYYTSTDLGSKVFDWQSSEYAGSGTVSVVENISASIFTDVKFQSSLNGIACSVQGMIKRTVDGANWSAVNSTGTGNYLNCMTYDQSGANYMAAGNAGIVLVSTTQAQSFYTVDTGIGVNLNGIYFVDVSTVYACGNGGKIVKSTDTGDHWTANIGPGGETANFNSVYFLNDSTGFVCGNGGVGYKTSDGGNTWTALGSPAGSPNLLKIQMLDELNGFVSAAGGKVFKTADSGASWTDVSPAGADTPFPGLHFYNANLGYVAGPNRTIFKTANGGTNWTRVISSNTSVDFNGISVAATDPTSIIAVGTAGTIIKSADSGGTWNEIHMQGASATVNWNGLILTSTSTAKRFLQGRNNQVAIKLFAKTLFGGNSTISAFKVSLNNCTATDSDVSSVKFYKDSNNDGNFSTTSDQSLGTGVFSGGIATVSGFSSQIIGSATYFMIINIPTTATIGRTLGFLLDTDALTVSSGKKLAKNGLPKAIDPVDIQPSSCTMRIGVTDLTGATVEVTQGQTDVQIAQFDMITDRAKSPLRRVIVSRAGINNSDAAFTKIYLWQSPDNNFANRFSVPVGTATFGSVTAGLAYIDITGNNNMTGYPLYTLGDDGNGGLDSDTTAYFFLTADISPNAIAYTDTTDARFWLSFSMTTSYFLLDPEGANGISSAISSYECTHIRIKSAFNTLNMAANNPPVGISVRQSDTVSFIPIQLQRAASGGSINWTRLSVAQTGTAADSDIDSVAVYRDVTGNNVFDSNDTAAHVLLGSSKFSSGQAQIIFNNPEDLTDTLTSFATYFVTVSVYKRATENNTVQIQISSQSFTLAGTDVVDGPTLTSPVAVINNYPDPVNCSFTSVSPKEARIDEANIAVSKLTLWAKCSATLTKIAPEFIGTGSYSDISSVKFYGTSDQASDFDPTVDTLLGSGAYGTDGKAPINLTITPSVYDSSYTVFIVYDLNSAGTPNKTAGFGLSDSANTLAFPGELGAVGKFGYYISNTLNMLPKETPSIPQLSLSIGWPSGRKVSGRTVYYSNDPAGLTFGSQASALNGVASTKYGLASFDVTATTDTPDVITWQSTTISSGTFSNLNLQHNTTYYLWVKAVSTDGYERVTSAMILVDLMKPAKPSSPTDTSPKAHDSASFMSLSKAASTSSSFWVNWVPVDGSASGVLYYELEERADTSPLWTAVSTTTATSYMINKDTYTDQGKFFYYRVRAKNYAGSWGPYSEASSAAYLSLPTDLFKDLASYPNPFDSRTRTATITFLLNQQANVEFRIYTLLGGLIKQWNIVGEMGPNNITWDGTDDNGNKVAAGMYILNVEVKTGSDTLKKRWKIGVIH